MGVAGVAGTRGRPTFMGEPQWGQFSISMSADLPQIEQFIFAPTEHLHSIGPMSGNDSRE